MGILKNIKKKFYNSETVKRGYNKYCEDANKKDDNTSLSDLAQMLSSQQTILSKICLYEKARTKLKEDIFTIQFEDTIIKFYLPNATKDLIQQTIFESDAFFEEDRLKHIRQYITSESVVLDAGTNIGNHTIFFSKICNAKKVYSFEPLKTVFGILEKNIEINNIQNVERFNLALGENKGFANISDYNSLSIGSTQFKYSETGAFEVISLDSLNLEKLDFAKVDVEGCQYEFLKGARNTLEKCKPIIWIEMLDEKNAWFNYNHEHELVLPQQLLKDMGYELKEKMSDYDYLYVHKST